MRNGGAAVALMSRRRHVQDLQLGGRFRRIGKMRRDQGSRIADLGQEERNARMLGQLPVARAGAGGIEQLVHDPLVHVGILPQVDRREVEAEYAHGAAQSAQPSLRQVARTICRQRIVNRLEIGAQLGGGGVGGRVADRMPQRLDLIERPGGRRQACIHAGDRPPIRLVLALIGAVRRLLRQRTQPVRDPDHAAIERQISAQLMQLIEVEPQHASALPPQRLAQGFGRHERIAVAIAADPAADAEERLDLDAVPRRVDAAEVILEIGIEARQLAKESVVVVGEAVDHFIDHPQPRAAQDAGLPQGQDGAAQGLVVGCELFRGERAAVALVEQPRDLHLAVDRAATADLRRMGGQDRGALGRRKECLQLPARQPGCAGARQGMRHRAFARRGVGHGMRPGPADVVLVFGDIGEMREIPERPDDADRLLGRQAADRALQLLPGGFVRVAMEAKCRLTERLDDVERLRALLEADRVPENAPEQTDVLAQRRVLLQIFAVGQGIHGQPDVCVGARPCALRPRRDRC